MRVLTRSCFVLAAVVASGIAHARAADSIAKGEQLFKARCKVCHTVDPGGPSGLGPNLAGVVGRKSGSVPDFHYSEAFQKSNIKWSLKTLDIYLAAPAKLIPGNRMTAFVPKKGERKAILTYLAAESGTR